MTQDLTHYDARYYTRPTYEQRWNGVGSLRPDQCAAVGYLFGLFDLKKIHALSGCPAESGEPIGPPDNCMKAWKQATELRKAGGGGDPGAIVSIGCGLGLLETTLWTLGEDVRGYDPAPYPRTVWPQSGPSFAPLTMGEAAVEAAADALLLVESLEHVPRAEFWLAFHLFLKKGLRRLIVTNWRDKHPIHRDKTGWDHIEGVDDALYSELSGMGTVRVRVGSHLVVDFT